jgi:UDP-N-acetylmuramate-alanine ligase
LNNFSDILKSFDNIIITNIYSINEENNYNVSSLDLVDKIKIHNKNVIFLDNFYKIINYIKSNVNPKDIVIILGAGDIVNICKDLINY